MDIYATHMYVTHVRDKRACAGTHAGAHNGTFGWEGEALPLRMRS